MLLEYDFRKRKVRDRVTFELHTPEPGPMPVAGPEVSAQIRQMIEGRRIASHADHPVERAVPEEKRIVFKDGASVRFDLLAYAPPHRAPQGPPTILMDGEWPIGRRENSDCTRNQRPQCKARSSVRCAAAFVLT